MSDTLLGGNEMKGQKTLIFRKCQANRSEAYKNKPDVNRMQQIPWWGGGILSLYDENYIPATREGFMEKAAFELTLE